MSLCPPLPASYLQQKANTDELIERTLDILYSAQRQLPESDLPASSVEEEAVVEDEHMIPEPTRNQQSLHQFWNIRSAPRSAAGVITSEQSNAAAQHARSGVESGNGQGESMDVDM